MIRANSPLKNALLWFQLRSKQVQQSARRQADNQTARADLQRFFQPLFCLLFSEPLISYSHYN